MKIILRPLYVGQCIYCQKPARRLTEEHIVPVGLGGRRTLPNASCETCRQITHAFETTALRHVLGPGRYWLGIQPRRRNSRPQTWPAYKADGQTKVEIPLDDLPFFLNLPTYTINPAIRSSIPNDHEPTRADGGIFVSEDPERINVRLRQYDADHFMTKLDHLSFAKMLTKIALGYCVAEFGYGTFTPMVTPLILGMTNAFPNLVSSSFKPINPDVRSDVERRFEHNLMHKIAQDTGTICVRIDLFKNLDAPSYYVMAAALKRSGAGHLLLSTD